MNSCARAQFDEPGYVGTAKLNGCIAAVAGYRSKPAIHMFLGHYDAERVREVDAHDESRLGGLLTAFAGERAVKVCVAYPKEYTLTRGDVPYDPEFFPVEAIQRKCLQLPPGSQVLFVPYTTSTEFGSTAKTGHILYAGFSGSGSMEFGWNGHRLEVGSPEMPTDEAQAARRLAVARSLAEGFQANESLIGNYPLTP